MSPFSTTAEALEGLRAGGMVVVCDAEDRRGHLTLAAQFATPAAIDFMAGHGRGPLCTALAPERYQALGLSRRPAGGPARPQTASTGSVAARHGGGTGVSAADRARTVQALVDPGSRSGDLVRPGHMLPLQARPGGVLERAGHAEAAVDLARLAGLIPAGVICEVMNDDGTTARVPELVRLCATHGLPLITVRDLIAHRHRHEQLVERVVETAMPTRHGTFRAIGYRQLRGDLHHLALVCGDVAGHEDVLVRVHSACLTGDAFGSQRCDCGDQLEEAMRRIDEEGQGVVLYLAQEGRGIGLLDKLKAYRLQEQGYDTVDADLELGPPVDLRDYGVGAQILADLGLGSLRLLTNNPNKISALQGYGLRVSDQVPLQATPGLHNEACPRTKARRLGHLLDPQLAPR